MGRDGRGSIIVLAVQLDEVVCILLLPWGLHAGDDDGSLEGVSELVFDAH